MVKKILLGVLCCFAIMQFFRIDKTNPSADPKNDFVYVTAAGERIEKTLKTSCYDCHSNESEYPWYTNVAPASWWIKNHIDHAREELNFSKWNTYDSKKKKHKLEECIEMLEKKEMPLKSYLILHDNARLDEQKREQLMQWFKELMESKEHRSVNHL